MLIVLSFCGHTDSYRLTVYGHGAFELCLPSLGFFFTKLSLRSQISGQRSHMTKVRTLGSMSGLEQYEVLTLLEVYAEQPIDCDAAGRYDNDVEPYVVDGFQYDIDPMR